MNPELFVKELAKKQIKLTAKQKQLFNTYFTELVKANQHVNLTRITAEDDVYLKHFYDSLTPLLNFKEQFTDKKTLCDLGAGAGFPSIPLKIVLPQLQVTIVDSLGKRLVFLQQLLKDLQLSGVQLVHARAEDAGQNPEQREKYDLVTARAVANMPVLTEYCLPLVKKGGYLIALKGPQAQEELQKAQKAIKVLGAEVVEVKELTLPASSENRTLILLKKVKNTPKKYPRQAGTPHRKPII